VTGRGDDWLAERFEASRTHLQSVAYRMLGSRAEADDAVQETWLRLSRADTREVENLRGWLTTVVARVCLDMLRSRKSRREESLDPGVAEPAHDAEQEALLADSVGLALLVVLQTLTPAERVAFVLHDMFDLPFEEIAPIVGRTPAAARQLASRARRRVREAPRRAAVGSGQLAVGSGQLAVGSSQLAVGSGQWAVVEAFLAAARGGDFQALLALLDPEVVMRSDAAAVRMGAQAEVRGAKAVAEQFAGRAKVARPALVDGAVGLVWAPGGQTRVYFAIAVVRGKIAGIELVADPERLGRLHVSLLPPPGEV
jgi:RNA polymerase sigma-70 factor (ECF subfamily)